MPSTSRTPSGKAGGRASEGSNATPPPDQLVAADSNDDPLHTLVASLGALRREVRVLCEVRLDQLRVAVHDLVFGAVAKSIGWLGALLLGLVAVVFVMYGTALGLARLFGDRTWVGFLLAGLLLLFTVGVIVLLVEQGERRRRRRRLEDKYAPEESED